MVWDVSPPCERKGKDHSLWLKDVLLSCFFLTTVAKICQEQEKGVFFLVHGLRGQKSIVAGTVYGCRQATQLGLLTSLYLTKTGS